MKIRMTATKKKVISGILLLGFCSFLPAVLFAQIAPLGQADLEMREIEVSQRRWSSLKQDVHKIIEKSNATRNTQVSF